jgi:carboxylesterase type B
MAVNFRGGLPVVILLEGEGFVSGLVSRFPGQDLAAEGVIVVSVSYRLNVFGKSKWTQLAELILSAKVIQTEIQVYHL